MPIRETLLMLAVGLSLPGFSALGHPNQQAASTGKPSTVLNERSFWRFHVTLRPPTVAGEVLPVKVAYRHYPGIERVETAAPPDAWAGCDFDDADWPRAPVAPKAPGSLALVAFAPAVRFSAAMVCLRGKFLVTDPAAVGRLELAMKYRGGAVVRLNGREVLRMHMPAGGADANTPAEPYPPEAFVDAAGKPIPDPWRAGKRIQAGETDLTRRMALRDRELQPTALETGALRKGVNVLAVELHRAPYHPSAKLWFRDPHFNKHPAWVLAGLTEIRLAAAGDGARPNVARPAGLQVWNHDVNDRVTAMDYGDPCEKLRPLSIVAARNGAYSARVVVGSPGAIRGLSARATPLKTPDGRHTIDAKHVQVRYARLDASGYQRPDWFDGLLDRPPGDLAVHKAGGGAVQPVWLTVHVPATAAAGDYTGELALSADGSEPVAVPIRLHVAAWALPDPKDFHTYVGVYQSPTSLALKYKLPEWSEGHWRLMERAFTLLGQLGNKIVNIPVVNRTQFGNDSGMITWRRKPGGGFEHDFAVFDRYLRLVAKHLGRPDFVALHVWHSGGWGARKATQQNTVTVVDRQTGRRERMQVPAFGTDDSKRFWKPVLDAIRQRLADAGMAEAMCLGILSDGTAPPEVFRAFDEIMPPAAKWTRGCHTHTRNTEPYPLKGGGIVVCHEHCYGMAMADPAKGLPAIWKQRSRPAVAFIRHNFDDRLSLLKYRTMSERALYCGTRGIGRMGLDFWDVTQDARGRPVNIYNRWPHSSCAQRSPNLFRLAAAGPDGPIPTVRFEQFREGIQDTEATVFVARALGENADKLGADLADECRRVLVDRMRYCRRSAPEGYGRVYFRSYHHGWRDLTRRLYAAAANAAAKLSAS